MNTKFDAYRTELLHGWLRVLTTLGYSLVPLFFILDTFIMPPELLPTFAVYRGTATVIILGQHFVVRRTLPSRFSFLHGYVFSIVTGGMIVLMTTQLGGFSSTYYAGLNLVIVAVNLLLPWRAIHSAFNGVLVLVLYLCANLVFGGELVLKDVVNNLYFMGGTIVIAVALTQVRFRQIAGEYGLRDELLTLNESLDRSRGELKSARDALWGEMEVAKRIQTALLPPNRRLGSYEVGALMQPAAEVGGDYYDIIETPHGENWLAVGDVSGHGVESGLVMMMTQTAIATLVCEAPGRKPSEVFDTANRTLFENITRLGSARFMSLNVARLASKGLTLAGKHQDLMVWRAATQQVEVIVNDGCWLGVVRDTRGRTSDLEVPLSVGDVVLFYSDGVTEACNSKREMYSQTRLAEALARVAQQPVSSALEALLGEVNAWQVRQEDDVTLLMARCVTGGM